MKLSTPASSPMCKNNKIWKKFRRLLVQAFWKRNTPPGLAWIQKAFSARGSWISWEKWPPIWRCFSYGDWRTTEDQSELLVIRRALLEQSKVPSSIWQYPKIWFWEPTTRDLHPVSTPLHLAFEYSLIPKPEGYTNPLHFVTCGRLSFWKSIQLPFKGICVRHHRHILAHKLVLGLSLYCECRDWCL